AEVQADTTRASLGRLLTTGPQRRNNARVLCGHVHSVEKAMHRRLTELLGGLHARRRDQDIDEQH
ncbi:hypothetical protein, partial [Aeromonas hydrophila]|uniref:hypothetical protein n=1 Tax=Aeromonas hydrophila TaxID=644 RepID=UPI0036DE6FB5